MLLIYLVLFLCLAGFIYFLIQKFRKDSKYGRRFYDFGDGNFVVYAIFALIISFFAVRFGMDEPHFKSRQEQVEYGDQTVQPWLVSAVYRSMVEKDSLNLDNHFHLVRAHFDRGQENGPSVSSYNSEGAFIYNYYTKLSQSSDPHVADIGYLMLGIYYYYNGDQANSRSQLGSVKDSTLKYFHNYRGLINYYYNRDEQGKNDLKEEIRLNGYKEGAYYNLSRFYDYEKRIDLLTPLVYNPESKPFVPFEFRKEAYIYKRDVKMYFSDMFGYIFHNGNLVGFSGALLILVTWMIYLFRVNKYRRRKWMTAIPVVLFSAVLVFPVWLLYDFYQYALGFDLNGEIGHDFLYCVFGIGVIEELVKILPFLLVLWFTRAIKEPIDYIMYASLSALGFAFVENFQYFREGSLHIIHTRALTASISHMIDSSIIAYGLILAKFRYKKSPVLFFFLFFLIAAFAHGFYDFWLLNEKVASWDFAWVFTFLCLLTSILVYASFINNALNNPVTPHEQVQLNTSRLASDLAAMLTGIFVFEFLCLSFIYGPTIGIRELILSLVGGGYMILFLSIRLSNIDIFPGDWSRISFFVGLMPASIIYGGKKPNYNSVPGTLVRIRNFRKKGKLEDVLPVEGEVIRREKISGFTGWFLVKLDKPMPYKRLNNDYVLVRSKNPVDLIGRDEDIIIHFVTIPDLAALDKPVKRLEDFKFIDWAVAGRK